MSGRRTETEIAAFIDGWQACVRLAESISTHPNIRALGREDPAVMVVLDRFVTLLGACPIDDLMHQALFEAATPSTKPGH